MSFRRQYYALGFAFDATRTNVALIEKARPEWQAGKLNGIGGHVEPTDSHTQAAMVREFQEEAGVLVPSWYQFAMMQGSTWVVDCFAAHVDLTQLRTMTDEPVQIVQVDALPENVLSNLRWLIPLALDDSESSEAVIDYR